MTDTEIRDILWENHVRRHARRPLLIAVVLLLGCLAGSNLAWYRAYHKLDLYDMQTSALLDWSNEMLHCKEAPTDNPNVRVENCGSFWDARPNRGEK
jgi:hypothetical protein